MPTRFYVEERTDYRNAQSFGTAGPYEFIVARAVTDAGEGRIEVLKPRDPAKASGTMVFALNPAKRTDATPAELNRGDMLVRLYWRDRASALQGVHDVLDFFRITGGPMLFGDLPRYIKRTLAANAGSWLPEFNSKGLNKGSKDRSLIDGEWTKEGA